MQSVISRRAATSNNSSNKKSSRAKRSLAIAAAAGLSFVAQEKLNAAQFYWAGDHDNSWNTTGGFAGTNWSSQAGFNSGTGATLRPTSTSDVFFNVPGAGNLTTVLGADFTINSLTFSNAETAGVTVGGVNTLTIGAGGLINNSAQTNTVSTNVTILGSQTWADNTSSAVLVTGAVGGNATSVLTVGGGGTFNFSGINTYSGNTSVLNAGSTLILSGANGSLASGNVTLDGGTQFIFDNTAFGNGSRVGATTAFNSNGGTIYLKGANSTSQTVGNLALPTGDTQIQVDSGDTLTFANWTHTAGGAVNFQGNGTTIVTGLSNNAGGTIGGWATVGNVGSAQQDSISQSISALNFATVGAGNSIVALANYTANFTGAGNNTQLTTGNSTLTGNTTINSLYVSGSSNFLLGAHVLTLASGGLIANGGTNSFGGSGPQITFTNMNDIGSGTISSANASGNGPVGSITSGTSDLVITTASNLRLDATIVNGIGAAATLSLVKDGSGVLDLSDGNQQTASLRLSDSYTGNTTINGGLLIINSDANLGADPTANNATNIIMNGGELRCTATLTINSHRGITVGPQGGTISYNGGSTTNLSGFLVTGSGSLTYKDIPSFGITASGFSSSSAVNSCAIEVNYTTTNYAGATTFLTVASNTSTTAASAVIWFGQSNEVPSTSSVTVTGLNNNLQPNAVEAVLDINGTTQSFGSLAGAGTVVNASGTAATLVIGANNLSTVYSGNLGTTGITQNPAIGGTTNANISVTKIGTGTQTFGGVNQYTGATSIQNGKLVITGSMANTAVTVGNGTVGINASLGGNGTLAGAVTVNSNGILAPAVTTSGVSTLTLSNNLVIHSGAQFSYNFGAANVTLGTPGTSDMIVGNSASNFSLSGNVSLNINPLSGFGVGVYKMVDWTASSASFTDTANFTINGSTLFNYAVVANGGALAPSVGGGTVPLKDIYLEVMPGNPALFWTGTVGTGPGVANGNWDIATTANWAGAATTYTNGSNVTFDDPDLSGPPNNANAPGATNVTVTGGGVSPNSVTFNNSGFDLTIGGGSITVANNAGIVKGQGGNVTLNNTVTTPTTTVNGGDLIVGSTGNYTSTNSVALSGGTMTVNGILNTPTLNATGGGALSVAATGSLGNASVSITVDGSSSAAFSNSAQTIGSLNTLAGGTVALNGTNLSISGNSSIAGSVSGTLGALTVTGGTTTVSSANTYTGNTTVGNGATLFISNTSGSATGSGAVNVQSGGTLSGTGITAGGLVTISAGTLSPAGNGTVGTITLASLALQNGATLQYDIANGLAGPNDLTAVTGAATLSGNESLTVNNPSLLAAGNYTLITAASVADTANFTGNITIAVPSPVQNYSVQKVGNSVDLVVTFSSPTWTGFTNGNWDTATANWSPSPTGVFLQHEGAIFDNTLAGGNSGNTSVNVVGNIITDGGLTFNNTTAVTYTITSTDAGDQISGLGGITVNGNGTVNIVSNAMNTFTGATVLNAGVLNVDSLADGGVASAIGQATNDPSNLVFNGGTLQYTNNQSGFFPMSTDHLFTLGPSGGTIDSSAPQSSAIVQFTNPGAIAFSGTGNRTLTLTGSNLGDGATIAGTNSLAASIGDAVPGTSLTKVLKTGAGAWALIGSNSYTGGTTISAGTLMTAADNNLGASASPVLINGSGATLWISTNAVTGTHDITIGASGGTLQIDNSYTLSGNSSLLEGSGPLTIKGPGTLVLNTPNNFTGSVLVDPSKLYVNGSLPAASTVTVASGSNLGGTGTVHGAVVVQGGGSIEGGQNLAGQLTIGGPVTFQGAATVNIGNLAAYVPGTAAIVDQGTVSTDGTDTIGFSLNGSAPSTGTFALFDFHGATPTTPAGFALAGASNPHLGASLHTVTIAPSTQEVQLTLNVTPIVWTNGSTNSLWDINTSQNWKVPPSTATNYFEGDIVSFDDTATGGNPQNITIAPASVNPNGVTFNNNAVAYTIGGGAIAGATGVTLKGGGTVTFTTASSNTYAGGTTIVGGSTLVAAPTSGGSDLVLGAIPSSFQPANITLGNATTGGTLSITSGVVAQTADGAASAISANRGITLGAGGGTINVGFTDTVTGSHQGQGVELEVPGLISGPGGLTVTGLTGANPTGNGQSILSLWQHETYQGNTTINNAVVQIENVGGNANGTSAAVQNVLPLTTVLNLVNNGMFNLATNGSNLQIAGLAGDTTGVFTTSNNGAIVTLTIQGSTNNTFAGFIGSGTVGSVVQGKGITLPTNIGRIALAMAGTGTQTLTGTLNNFVGGTIINGGTIRANNASGSALGVGTVAVNSGGTLGGTGFTGNGTVTVNSGGTITAGADATHAGNFTVGDGTNGNLTMAGGASYLWKLNDFNGNLTGTPGTNWDLVNVNGALTFSGNTAVTVAMAAYGGATPAQGAPVNNFSGNQTFEIASFASTNLAGVTAGGNQTIQLTDPTTGLGTGAYTGLFALNTSGFTNEPTASTDGAAFLEFIGSGAGTGGTLDVSYGTYTATPEPGTTLLVLAGGLPMLAARRRRRQKQADQA